MSSAGARAAGRRLRDLRVSAGLTQEELAARSGISARALRALETGATKSARPYTIGQISGVLGLGDAEADNLLRLWRLDGQATSYESLYVRTDSERFELSALKDRQLRGLRTVSEHVTEVVGVDRRQVSTFANRTVQVVESGVDRVWQTTQLEADAFDVKGLVIAHPRNAHVGESRFFSSIGIFAVELLFGRDLPVGSRYSFGFGFDFRGTHTERSGVIKKILKAAAAPWSGLTLTVQFTEPEFPIEIRQVAQPKVDIPLQVVGPVELSSFGAASVVVEAPEPGAYGLAWNWPD